LPTVPIREVGLTPGWSGAPREGCRRRCGAEGGCRVPRKKHHQRITAWSRRPRPTSSASTLFFLLGVNLYRRPRDRLHAWRLLGCLHAWCGCEASLIARIAAGDIASWIRSWLCPRTRLEGRGAMGSSAFRQPQGHCPGGLPSNNRQESEFAESEIKLSASLSALSAVSRTF
jgi:hypothetical protein